MKSLGIDVGSSSVKVTLMDIATGECVASATQPSSEMPIDALQSGWAEQDPMMWWKYACEGIKKLAETCPMSEVKSIGITYQMHGLVCMDKNGNALRKAIIWCDGRAVEIGDKALEALGREATLARTLNSPGNFTASKLAWVKANEPEIFAKTYRFMLPGDFITYKLSGEMSTTDGGLSEGILWDFKNNCRADFVADYYGIPAEMFPEVHPNIGIQARTNAAIEKELGIKEGTHISYRAGDQPNNAFSLNVMESGEIAATGGTSGVVYGVTDLPKADPESRVNTFVHVNHSAKAPRYGVLLCINGTGIMNAWIKRAVAPELSYEEMNDACANIPAGCDGVTILPFGNGAERMLCNKFTGATIAGVEFNKHNRNHLLRAAQEGIAYSFRYGIDIMKEVGLNPSVIRAGKANLFLSPLFRSTLATLCDARIELYNTDGSLGAARGAALGAGFYKNREEAFASLRKLETIEPDASQKAALEAGYAKWKEQLEKQLTAIK